MQDTKPLNTPARLPIPDTYPGQTRDDRRQTMTLVYDMADGSIRSDEHLEEQGVDRQETDTHTTVETVVPELQVVDTHIAPRDDAIHLIGGLLKKD
jgi:hypothetical protein